MTEAGLNASKMLYKDKLDDLKTAENVVEQNEQHHVTDVEQMQPALKMLKTRKAEAKHYKKLYLSYKSGYQQNN